MRLYCAITLVYRLLFTTVLYSSGPVTEWIWNSSRSASKKPRDIQNRAVDSSRSVPSRSRKSASPVAYTYFIRAYTMSASMWYCAVPAA